MYQHGYGVKQDYARAHMWLNISASQGHRNALVNHDIVEKEMTPSELLKARELARECVAKNYKNC
jgi:TPR repeat protein